MQRIKRFFIDESGNTGDATRTGMAFDFDNQPIFVLACLGVRDTNALSETFSELKARHRFRGPEIKSDAAWKKPGFYIDLIGEIERLDLPLLLEVVDKRFFIAAQMVNTLILPSIGGDIDHSPKVAFMRNAIAAKNYRHMRPGLEDEGTRLEVEVTDPFNNHIRFMELKE